MIFAWLSSILMLAGIAALIGVWRLEKVASLADFYLLFTLFISGALSCLASLILLLIWLLLR